MTSPGSGFKIQPSDLHSGGSTAEDLGSKLTSGGSKLGSIGSRLSTSARSDKSGVGKIITDMTEKTTQVAGKVFTEGGRVASEAGKRLHSSATNHSENESSVKNSFSSINSPSSSRGIPPPVPPRSNPPKKTPPPVPPPRGSKKPPPVPPRPSGPKPTPPPVPPPRGSKPKPPAPPVPPRADPPKKTPPPPPPPRGSNPQTKPQSDPTTGTGSTPPKKTPPPPPPPRGSKNPSTSTSSAPPPPPPPPAPTPAKPKPTPAKKWKLPSEENQVPATTDPRISTVAANPHVNPNDISPGPDHQAWVTHDGNTTINRVDARPPVDGSGNPHPDGPFTQGFTPRPGETSGNIPNYQGSNQPSMFVGTTTNTHMGTGGKWANMWKYEVQPPAGQHGINVNDTLAHAGLDNPKPNENEIVFPGGIKTQYIVGAQKLQDGLPVGQYYPNPNFGRS